MPSLLSRKPDAAAPKDGPGGRYYSRALVAAFVFSAAINVLMLSVPLYSLQVFSRAIPSGNVDTLIMLTVIVVLALTVIALLESIRSRLLSRCGNAIELAWRRRLSAEVLDSAARGRPETAPLADLMEVKGALGRPTFTALMDLPWTPLYVIGIYVIHPLLAAVMLASMVVLAMLGWVGHVALRGPGEDSRSPTARAHRLFEAVQARADTVRALRMAPATLDAIMRDSMTAAALSGRSAERGALISSVTKWVRYLLQIAVTGIGAWLVIEHHLSFGGMIATSLLVGRGMAALEQTVGAWGSILKSWQAWKRLAPMLRRLAREPERGGVALEPGRLSAETVLFVNGRDQKPVLRAVTFQIEAGETACFLGVNRSGKSVLARLLAGVQAPTSGTVRFGGLAVAALAPKDPENAIGYLPQVPDLLPGSVAENIARFLPADRGAVVAAARRAGIHEWVETLPHGYDTDVMDPVAPVAGASARLVALARAGFGRPPLIVLDEPALGLDEQGAHAVRTFIADAKAQGVTVVVLSCNAQFVDLADKTFVLQNGLAMPATPRRPEAAPAVPGLASVRGTMRAGAVAATAG